MQDVVLSRATANEHDILNIAPLVHVAAADLVFIVLQLASRGGNDACYELLHTGEGCVWLEGKVVAHGHLMAHALGRANPCSITREAGSKPLNKDDELLLGAGHGLGDRGSMNDPKRYVVDVRRLPSRFPTHLHAPAFWEALGRAVGTFGFLEETLGRAIFSFTATRQYTEHEIQAAYEKWLPTLQRALSDPLGQLIDTYGRAVREHQDATIENLSELLADLRAAAVVRNVISHGSWRAPDESGQSLPLFINRQGERFDTPIDTAFLDKVQRHAGELACAVVNTVTHMGWQFPGSLGPGQPIWSAE